MPKLTNDGLKKRCSHARKSWRDCSCPWWFGYHYGEREYRFSLTKLARARGETAPRSKEEAIVWRDRLRAEIGDGKFVDPHVTKPTAIDTRLTFGDVCDRYLEGHVREPGRRPRGQYEMEMLVRVLRRAEIPGPGDTRITLETKPIDAITKADVEALRAWRRAQQAAGEGHASRGQKGGEVGTNRLVSRMRHLFFWAVGEGYCSNTPFRRGGVAVVKINTRAEGNRLRRLAPGEEAPLLQYAGPHLRTVIVAALSTGCRIGELLSLQWSQIRYDDQGDARWVVLPSAKAKTNEPRVLPIGARLRAELSMRRHGQTGRSTR